MTRIRESFIANASATAANAPNAPRARTEARFVGGPGLVLDPSLSPTSLAKNDTDHSPVLFSVGHGKERVDVLSWNVCFRYRFDAEGKHFNNGFGRDGESVDAYHARLTRSAAHLEGMVRSTKPAPPVVMLQETPSSMGTTAQSHAHFERELRARMGPLGYEVFSSGDRFTLVRGDSLRTPIALPPALAKQRQGGTLDAFLLEEPRTIVVNMHLKWDRRGSAEEAASRATLAQVVEHLQAAHPGVPILFAGDANRLPVAAPEGDVGGRAVDVVPRGHNTVVIAPPGPTNLRFNTETHKPEMTWADFAFWIPAAVHR